MSKQLALSIQRYFSLAEQPPLLARLAELLVRFEAAVAAGVHQIPFDFQDGILKALPALRTFALSLTGSEARADDLVQETLLRAWTNQHSFAPRTQLRPWLFTIQRNLFYSDIRKRRREIEDVEGGHAAGLVALPDQEHTVALLSLYEALDTLPKTQRAALLLVGAEGYTYEQAAERLVCSVGTVKSRVSRARSSLAYRLGV